MSFNKSQAHEKNLHYFLHVKTLNKTRQPSSSIQIVHTHTHFLWRASLLLLLTCWISGAYGVGSSVTWKIIKKLSFTSFPRVHPGESVLPFPQYTLPNLLGLAWVPYPVHWPCLSISCLLCNQLLILSQSPPYKPWPIGPFHGTPNLTPARSILRPSLEPGHIFCMLAQLPLPT